MIRPSIFFVVPFLVILAVALGTVDPILQTAVPAWNPLDWDGIFDIAADGSLTNRRVWGAFGPEPVGGSIEELNAALGPEDGRVAAAYWGAIPHGNWEHTNVLNVLDLAAAGGALHDVGPGAFGRLVVELTGVAS